MSIMDLTKTIPNSKISIEEQDMSDEEREERRMAREIELEVMKRLIQPSIMQIDKALTEKR